MSDANMFTRTSPPPPRTSSLADIVHRSPAPVPRQPPRDHSDDGSQQERNHQRANALPRFPLPSEAGGSNLYRKRRHSQMAAPNPPDLSSLTKRREDYVSSAAGPVRPGEGKGKVDRGELLEENRVLRIEMDNLQRSLRKYQARCSGLKKELRTKERLLNKYREQLVELFETGEGDIVPVNKNKYGEDQSPRKGVGDNTAVDAINSKIDGESISNSHDGDWSSYSGPSMSIGYDEDKSEERRRGLGRDGYAPSEATIRKHRRTRAPAWTQQEELIFKEQFNKHGCRWKHFQEYLPGRSRRQIQSHGSYLIRQGKLPRKNSRPWQRRKPRNEAGAGPSSAVKHAEVQGEEVPDAGSEHE